MRISDWSSDVCSSDLYSLRTESVAPVMGNGKAISSSRIREALQTGDCAEATRLLTRPFAIEGVVQHGDKVGSEIGYPTANIDKIGRAAGRERVGQYV